MARSFGGLEEDGAPVKFRPGAVLKRLVAGRSSLTIEQGLGAIGIAIAIASIAFASYMISQDNQGRREPNELAERLLFNAGDVRPFAGAAVDPMPTGSIAPSITTKRRGLSGVGDGPVGVEMFAPRLRGYVLRDVFEGVALVEGREGVRAVKPGFVLPGGDKVTAIERHGGKWIVVTTGGIISEAP